jgi:hypothetical protein
MRGTILEAPGDNLLYFRYSTSKNCPAFGDSANLSMRIGPKAKVAEVTIQVVDSCAADVCFEGRCLGANELDLLEKSLRSFEHHSSDPWVSNTSTSYSAESSRNLNINESKVTDFISTDRHNEFRVKYRDGRRNQGSITRRPGCLPMWNRYSLSSQSVIR